MRGARNRRTPYYEATQRYDPKGFTVYNHMYFPIRFDTFEAEFEALLNDVTLWDVSVERCLEISGPDGFAFAGPFDEGIRQVGNSVPPLFMRAIAGHILRRVVACSGDAELRAVARQPGMTGFPQAG